MAESGHFVRLILSAVDRTRPAIDAVRANLGQLQTVAGVASAAAAASLAALVTSAVDAQDELLDLNKSTGLTVELLAGLGFAAKTSGADLADVAKAVNKLSVEMGRNSEKFAQIGITAKDPLQALQQLADVFVSIEDPQQRAAVGAEALGKSWQSLAPLLSNGGDAIGELVTRGTELSGTTTESAERAAELNGQLDQLKAGAAGLSTLLANSLVPLLTDVAKSLLEMTDQALKADNSFSPLTETFRALIIVGGNVAFVFRGIGTEIGGIAAQIAALSRLDLSAFGAIGDAMRQDAARSRSAFDAWERSILSSGQKFDDYSNEGRGRGISPPRAAAPTPSAISGFLGGSRPAARRSGGGRSRPSVAFASALGSVQDYDAILMERLARAIEQTDVVKAQELAKMLEKLDQLAASGLDPALVTAVRDDLTGATQAAADELQRLNGLLEDTPTAEIEKARSDMVLLAKAVQEARISEEQYLEAVSARLTKQSDATKETIDQLDEFAIQSARSIQGAFADFLFDPFDKGTKTLAQSFSLMVRRMAAEAAAAELAGLLFGDLGGRGSSGKLGGLVGDLFSGIGDLFGGSAGGLAGLFGGGAGAPLAGSLGAAGGLPLPSFAVGSDYVPHNMVARIHRGEKIIPAAQNAAGSSAPNITINLSGFSGNAADLRQSAGAIARQLSSAVQGARRYG